MASRKKPFPITLLLLALLLFFIYFFNDGKFGMGESGSVSKTENQQDTSKSDPVDTLQTNKKTVANDSTELTSDSVEVIIQESEVVLPSFNTLWVTKQNKTIFYQINKNKYTNLLAGIAEHNYTLPYRVKLAGNLTYAEEREIKDILEEKDIEFTIVENL